MLCRIPNGNDVEIGLNKVKRKKIIRKGKKDEEEDEKLQL